MAFETRCAVRKISGSEFSVLNVLVGRLEDGEFGRLVHQILMAIQALPRGPVNWGIGYFLTVPRMVGQGAVAGFARQLFVLQFFERFRRVFMAGHTGGVAIRDRYVLNAAVNERLLLHVFQRIGPVPIA
ncbi:MAG: hypothetical protein HQ511_04585, partial [Rhodospirillales bacterium]|nr:hypothetical protein [Rhodospirillales bacterium]